MDLRPSVLESNDIIGDAYEYMIANFASDAGKKGGEFFTPSQVSKLVAMLVEPKENDRIYDPTCGSGGLLLKAYGQAKTNKVAIYGQEKNMQTWALCSMNMFLHGIDDAKIWQGDTLSNPQNLEDDKLMKFQCVVANPPFSLDKWDSGFLPEATDEKKNLRCLLIWIFITDLTGVCRLQVRVIMHLFYICYTVWTRIMGEWQSCYRMAFCLEVPRKAESENSWWNLIC